MKTTLSIKVKGLSKELKILNCISKQRHLIDKFKVESKELDGYVKIYEFDFINRYDLCKFMSYYNLIK